MISLYMLCLSQHDDYIAAIGAESLDAQVGPAFYCACFSFSAFLVV
jgi:hypothetical protein